MRISDWSSDVCSSDLAAGDVVELEHRSVVHQQAERAERGTGAVDQRRQRTFIWEVRLKGHRAAAEIGRAPGRERAWPHVKISVVAAQLNENNNKDNSNNN